jgi:hypothetical protein
MYYGFISGVGITSITAASAYYVRTATKVDVNEILVAARRSLNSSEDLRTLLGGYIYVGDLAGFRHTYGSWKSKFAFISDIIAHYVVLLCCSFYFNEPF